jgi:hypothetical protein
MLLLCEVLISLAVRKRIAPDRGLMAAAETSLPQRWRKKEMKREHPL